MRRRRAARSSEAPGQDSFLDIVANLVGILIILVIVVGIRTKDTLVEAASQAPETVESVDTVESVEVEVVDEVPDLGPEPEPENLEPIDVESHRRSAEAVEQSIFELDEKLRRQQLEVNFRRSERDRMQVTIVAAEKKLAEQKKQLSQQRQEELRRQGELAAAQREVDNLRTQLQAIETSSTPVERLDHLPTPMAKTVFGKEVHFRLYGGRLAFVPWDELVEKLKEDAPNRVWKLKDAPRITETIGPLGGFRLRYTLKKTEQLVRTDAGAGMQQRVELDYFHIVPVDSELGEPVAQAMSSPGSQLQNIVGSSDPKSTTITIWVYPDSFEDFRAVKEWLFKRGFLTASRPMPAGRLMGGAPEGSRSTSQ